MDLYNHSLVALGHYRLLVAKQQLSVARYKAAKECKLHAANITMLIRFTMPLQLYAIVFMCSHSVL